MFDVNMCNGVHLKKTQGRKLVYVLHVCKVEEVSGVSRSVQKVAYETRGTQQTSTRLVERSPLSRRIRARWIH